MSGKNQEIPVLLVALTSSSITGAFLGLIRDYQDQQISISNEIVDFINTLPPDSLWIASLVTILIIAGSASHTIYLLNKIAVDGTTDDEGENNSQTIESVTMSLQSYFDRLAVLSMEKYVLPSIGIISYILLFEWLSLLLDEEYQGQPILIFIFAILLVFLQHQDIKSYKYLQ